MQSTGMQSIDYALQNILLSLGTKEMDQHELH